VTSPAATLEEAPTLIVDARRSWIDRDVVLVAALAVYVLTSFVPNPWWTSLIHAIAVEGSGLSHTQYPLPMQLMVVLVGGLLGWLYLRSGNLLAPWIVHQLSDMVLDAILKT
jgi:hypothetical protein